MSRSLFKFFLTLNGGIKSRPALKLLRVKPLSYSRSPYFHTYQSFLQKEQKTRDETEDLEDDGDEEEKEKIKDGSQETRIISGDKFENVENKTKKAFQDMIEIFVASSNDQLRTGHMEFIRNALKHMKEFGVHKDLATYKKLMNVMPKGRYVAKSLIQSEYMHYPLQQQCMIDLLEQMEENGVIPDWEMEGILINMFGRRAHPLRRYWRMMYWMPKFKYMSPWTLPSPLPTDVLELAKLSIERITSVDVKSQISIFQTSDVEDSIDDTWIVSGQSPIQQELIENHPVEKPIFVEGGFRIWLRDTSMIYFILRGEPDKNRRRPVRDDYKADNVSDLRVPFLTTAGGTPDDDIIVKPTVHEQADGTIFAVCATGTSSKDSLLSWIRLLGKNGNPKLERIPVLFTFKSPLGPTVTLDWDEQEERPEPLEKQETSGLVDKQRPQIDS